MMMRRGLTALRLRDNNRHKEANPMSPLHTELSELLNKHSAENASDTPDWILAAFMLDCLKAFEESTVRRDNWHGVRS